MSLTYDADVAPHLARALMYHAKRNVRWRSLHRHDGRSEFWGMAILALLVFWFLVAYAVSLAIG